MKKLLSTLFIATTVFSGVLAERYQIRDVSYDITGITRQYALEKAVKIDKDRVFESYDELSAYVKDLQSRFNNERNLASALVNTSYDGSIDEEGISSVTLKIITIDSKHLLVLPYPKYNSNDGFNLKLKAKDSNFLGTMETLNCDVNFSLKNSDDNSNDFDSVIGVNFDYDYPFQLGRVDSSWNNSLSLDYTFGQNRPEFAYTTGLTFELPFKNYSYRVDLDQSITRDFDYTEYDDELYYTEAAKFSIPMIAGRIENFSDVTLAPFVSYTWNWDKNGINELNEDLSSPSLNVGYTVSTGRINWIGNFEEGVSASMLQSVGYNYQTEKYLAEVSGTLLMHKAFKYAGIKSRWRGFYNMNGHEKVGASLRGIRDDQKYSAKKWKAKYGSAPRPKALNSTAGIVGSIDIPFHIVTTNWVGFDEFIFGENTWMTNHLRWMRYFDFELQMAVFGDFALLHNEYTGKTFAIKDGFYAGGVEMIVFPAKWRSIQVRASAGMDAGRKIVQKVSGKLFDNSWREQVSALELSIGIGLQY